MTQHLAINRRIAIPLTELQFSFARSGGPGGQNVNKVNSKALLRWPVAASPSLAEDIRERFLARYGGQVSNEGDLLITSQRYRDQGRNVADCLEKLREMLLSVAEAPKKRKPKRITKAMKARRRETKEKISQRKQSRRQGKALGE